MSILTRLNLRRVLRSTGIAFVLCGIGMTFLCMFFETPKSSTIQQHSMTPASVPPAMQPLEKSQPRPIRPHTPEVQQQALPSSRVVVISHRPEAPNFDTYTIKVSLYRRDGWFNTRIPVAATTILNVWVDKQNPEVKADIGGNIYFTADGRLSPLYVHRNEELQNSGHSYLVLPSDKLESLKLRLAQDSDLEFVDVSIMIQVWGTENKDYSTVQRQQLAILSKMASR